jgi:hypothetical protein
MTRAQSGSQRWSSNHKYGRRFSCFVALLLIAVGVESCGASRPGSAPAVDLLLMPAPGRSEPLAVECAPFARALSGLQLRGAAADWWRQADGRYEQSQVPVPGSVLVLRRSGRLGSGHVAVVSRVLSERQILVTHANWVRHRLTADQPVVDISPDNDWSLLRVWWPPSGEFGVTSYPAYGFLLPDADVSPEDVAVATPLAVQLVSNRR